MRLGSTANLKDHLNEGVIENESIPPHSIGPVRATRATRCVIVKQRINGDHCILRPKLISVSSCLHSDELRFRSAASDGKEC